MPRKVSSCPGLRVLADPLVSFISIDDVSSRLLNTVTCREPSLASSDPSVLFQSDFQWSCHRLTSHIPLVSARGASLYSNRFRLPHDLADPRPLEVRNDLVPQSPLPVFNVL